MKLFKLQLYFNLEFLYLFAKYILYKNFNVLLILIINIKIILNKYLQKYKFN